MTNNKLQRVNPKIAEGAYIHGTQSENYFLIVSDTSDGIVAFRPLNAAIPALGTTPTKGVQTRVRVVPALSPDGTLDKLMGRFGFGRVNGGSAPVHYSTVTDNPAKAIEDAKLALETAA